ncbi:hypothetical protein ACFC58_07050 [Kitasatospora purpeofusca]|uniref:hypothetical protein n=1 Tax=Kitasatospora purpeofusca TaxID=67352 RepID=UPI0035DEC457
MRLTVQTLSFRCQDHARWSVLFDHLGVEWHYDQQAFPLGGGLSHRPAFWLPRQRLWFDASTPDAPVNGAAWRRFAYAALPSPPEAGTCIVTDLLADHPQLPPRLPEHWRGRALLATRPLTTEIPTRWDNPSDVIDLDILDDAYYQWTLCPECGELGAEYAGYANRMPCHRDDDAHNKSSSAHPALLAAYRAAADTEIVNYGGYSWDPFKQEHEGGWTRRILVDEELWYGDRQARRICTGHCRPFTSDWNESAPPEVRGCLDNGEAGQCTACPGTVCSACGSRPAPEPGEMCVGCRPLRPPLDEAAARRLINSMAATIASRGGQPIASVQYQINEHIGVRRRFEASLWCLVAAVDFATQWLTDLGWTPEPPGPLPLRTGSTPPSGAPSAAAPGQPAARPQVTSTLPAPRVVIAARRAGTCGLCLDEVSEGDTIGRIEIPLRGGYADPGWLCQHCLRLRRHAPRLRDVALRIFHRIWAGKPPSLNQLEVRLLANTLTARIPVQEVPDGGAAADDRQAAPVLERLTHSLAHGKPANLGTFEAINAIQLLASHPGDGEDRAVVDAVAAHLDEWRRARRGFGPHVPLQAQTPLRHCTGPYPV